MSYKRLIVAFLAGTALAVPSPDSLKSQVVILSDNDLQGPDGPGSAFGALYLSHKQSYQSAVDSCKALGEQLWTPGKPVDDHGVEILGKHLKSDGEKKAWITSQRGEKRAITKSGQFVKSEASSKLPVFCTQTAPYSNVTFTDTSSKWQIQVDTNNETLTGFRDRLSFRFHGIRYAPQPERFTYATMYNGSGEVVPALEYGPQCPQASGGGEDCLVINLWTPSLPPKKGTSKPTRKQLKPVIFWIFGGGFYENSANDPNFDGGNMASRGDVVMVAVNHRVGALGFLALEDGITNGNYGIADQILGLDWVRKNIADFGGDPERITIMGQSSGGASVRALMSSPKAANKFSAAMPLSGPGGTTWVIGFAKHFAIDSEEVRSATSAYLEATDCTDAPSPLDCLRAVDASVLGAIPPPGNNLVIDGTYLTTSELTLSLNGERAPYRLAMGITADDAAPFLAYPPNLTLENTTWLDSQELAYPPRSLFPPQNLQNETMAAYRIGSRVATDAFYRCMNQATVYAGLHNNMFSEVRYYEFDRSYQIAEWPLLDLCEPPPSAEHPFGDPNIPGGYLKCHSAHTLYVFGNINRMGLPFRDERGDIEFGQEILDRWAAFVWNRNPDVGPEWEPAVSTDLRLMALNWPESSMTSFRDLEQCEWLGLPIDYYI